MVQHELAVVHAAVDQVLREVPDVDQGDDLASLAAVYTGVSTMIRYHHAWHWCPFKLLPSALRSSLAHSHSVNRININLYETPPTAHPTIRRTPMRGGSIVSEHVVPTAPKPC